MCARVCVCLIVRSACWLLVFAAAAAAVLLSAFRLALEKVVSAGILVAHMLSMAVAYG